MAGFNRRFAPGVKEMSNVSNKCQVHVSKNDSNRSGQLRFKVFEFFMHPLDTALFLLDDKPLRANFHYRLDKDGLLRQLIVNLASSSSLVIASMNLQSGSRREVMEIQTPDNTISLENLDKMTV